MLQGGTKKAATKYDVEESCNQNAGTQDSACSVEKSSGGGNTSRVSQGPGRLEGRICEPCGWLPPLETDTLAPCWRVEMGDFGFDERCSRHLPRATQSSRHAIMPPPGRPPLRRHPNLRLRLRPRPSRALNRPRPQSAGAEGSASTLTSWPHCVITAPPLTARRTTI